jgi:ubiquinone/menaquinone biosynthesis C-methylase UbiE
MPTKFDTRKKHVLLSDERHDDLRPEEFLRELGVDTGQSVADLGCGPGFFTLPAARIVGEGGQVFAADIQGEMLTAVRSRAAEAGLTNVHVVKTSDAEIPIPAESCDFVLLFFVLHEIGQRAHFLHRAARLLKPGGKIVVLEWRRNEITEGPPAEDRVDATELEADAQAAGLRVTEQRDISDRYYLATLGPVKRSA